MGNEETDIERVERIRKGRKIIRGKHGITFLETDEMMRRRLELAVEESEERTVEESKSEDLELARLKRDELIEQIEELFPSWKNDGYTKIIETLYNYLQHKSVQGVALVIQKFADSKTGDTMFKVVPRFMLWATKKKTITIEFNDNPSKTKIKSKSEESD